MSLAFRNIRLFLAVVALSSTFAIANAAEPSTQLANVLRIAADPNNMPFSNDREEGYENKIAKLIADDLGMTIQYDWSAERRGFFREMIKHGPSEIVMGVPGDFERTATTSPYLRSTFVVVSRTADHRHIDSLDDAALRTLKIGITLTGGGATPPGLALAKRGIIDNVIGYSLYNDYREPNPSSAIVTAVAKGEVDIAIVWGPLASYFAKHARVALDVTPLKEQIDSISGMPLAFDIAVGVKRGNGELRARIDASLETHHAEIDKILDNYNVPRLPLTAKPSIQPTTIAGKNH